MLIYCLTVRNPLTTPKKDVNKVGEKKRRYSQQIHWQLQSQASSLWTLCSSEPGSFHHNTPGRFDSASLWYPLPLKNKEFELNINVWVKGSLDILYLSKKSKIQKHKKHFRLPHQQRLCHCRWWRLLRRCCQLQRHPVPVPPPSSVHHTKRWEPWADSTGWNPRYSSHLAFPPKYTHTDHLHERNQHQGQRRLLIM